MENEVFRLVMSVGHGKNCESPQGIGARNPEV